MPIVISNVQIIYVLQNKSAIVYRPKGFYCNSEVFHATLPYQFGEIKIFKYSFENIYSPLKVDTNIKQKMFPFERRKSSSVISCGIAAYNRLYHMIYTIAYVRYLMENKDFFPQSSVLQIIMHCCLSAWKFVLLR